MRPASASRDKITKQFIYFASKVSAFFPDLDVRFNLQGGSNTLRYTIPAVTDEVFELTLGRERIESLIHEAAFAIKELTQRFDA